MSDETELIDVVVNSANETDGRKKLPCAKAFQLAEEFNVPPARVGRICNDNNIKISNCQLGCFK